MGNDQSATDESSTQPQTTANDEDVSDKAIAAYFNTDFKVSLSPEVFRIRGELNQIRRYFHSNPELKYKELNTAKNVASYLKELNIETTTKIAETGVVGLLRGEHEGPTILLRADMDALPIVETPTSSNKEFISKTKGVMHACGHDAHMAILCGAAKILSQLRHMLHGNVKFCFQPAEEGGAGAKRMVEEKVLDDVDQVYGLHVWSYDKFGTARVVNGPLMAGCCLWEIQVYGKGGHAAIPQTTHDTIVAISHLTQQLHSIVSRNINPLRQAALTVGKITSGRNYNVISDYALLEGTMRWFEEEHYEILMERIRNICAGIEQSFSVRIEFKLTTPKFPPTTNRNKECCNLVAKSINQVLPATEKSGVIADPNYKTCLSEDFGFFLEERPGCFFFLGCGVEGDQVYPHHKPDFQLDERCLAVGAQIWVTIVLERLMQWKK